MLKKCNKITLKALIPPAIQEYVAIPPGHIGSSKVEMLSFAELGGIGYEGQVRLVSIKSGGPGIKIRIDFVMNLDKNKRNLIKIVLK